MQRFCSIFLIVSGLVVTGCSKSPTPRTFPVTGQVILEGSPLKDATVMLQPADGGSFGYGITDDDGQFIISTFEVGDGAIPGLHGIIVELQATENEMPSNLETPQNDVPSKQLQSLPLRYSKVETSGLEVDVVDGLAPLALNLSSVE